MARIDWESKVGERFYELTLTGYLRREGSHHYYMAECSCGTEVVVRWNNLYRGRTRSCGHLQRKGYKKPIRNPEVGERFGEWTALEEVDPSGGHRTWLVECSCGTRARVTKQNLVLSFSTECLGHEARTEYRPEEHLDDSYSAVHQNITKRRGYASEHPCVDCGEQAEHWSYVGGSDHEMVSTLPRSLGSRYSPYIYEDYEPRCRPCHGSYDRRRTCDEGHVIHGSNRSRDKECRVCALTDGSEGSLFDLLISTDPATEQMMRDAFDIPVPVEAA